jgi:RHS repeat-associated protein
VLQNFTFGYDAVGNLTARTETTQGVSESFTYDSLDRLSTVAGPAPKSYAYSEIGNITSKSDVGSYTYPASGKVHAVSSVAGQSWTYDANGNLLASGTRTLTWTSFNMPATAQVGASSYSWAYDADFRRVKFVSPTETTLYLASGDKLLVERVTSGGVTEERHQIYANGLPVAQYTTRTAGAAETRFLYRDQLGSATLVASEAGGVTETLAYDAQGKRRFPNGTDDTAGTLTGTATDRGYTGHEHLDPLGLIHMNGRLYDPRVGRFISADPRGVIVKNPQSWNRYSYVLNNPNRYTDPTGYDPDDDRVQPIDGPGLGLHIGGGNEPDGAGEPIVVTQPDYDLGPGEGFPNVHVAPFQCYNCGLRPDPRSFAVSQWVNSRPSSGLGSGGRGGGSGAASAIAPPRPPSPNPCQPGLHFDFDQFASDVRENRLSSVLGTEMLTDINLLFTAANTLFGYPRAGFGRPSGSPTTLLSRLGMVYPIQLPLRVFGTNNALRALGRAQVASTIGEGMYDLAIGLRAAIDATTSVYCRQGR